MVTNMAVAQWKALWLGLAVRMVILLSEINIYTVTRKDIGMAQRQVAWKVQLIQEGFRY